jgi:uncharacterized protein YdaU (DUF1376 family)
MHYFPFNIKDYASHTGHLSNLEDLAYRRLLEQYYLAEHPLNASITSVARLIRMKDNEQEISDVLNEFFTLTEFGWINHRANKEIEFYHSKIEQASKAGKASAEKRLNKRSTDVQPTINQEPLTSNNNINTIQSETSFPTCPYLELIQLWKTKLPHLRQPRSWEGARKTNMRNRWIQASKASNYSPEGYKSVEEGLRWWESFFNYIAKDTTLSNGFESQGRSWKPDLEWIVNSTNFQKIIDGKYNK